MKKIALLLVAAPLALVACGGGSANTQPGVDLVAFVKQAGSKTAGMPSEHMVMTAKISAGPMALKMNGSGDFSNTTKQGDMTVGMNLMGRNIRMEEVLDGTTIYMRSPMFSSQLPLGKTWMKLDLQKAIQSQGLDYSSMMSQKPGDVLAQLGAGGSVKSLGAETINGAETTHYQVTDIDISKLPQGAKVAALVHPKYGPINVWIGKSDGYVHRMSMSFTYSAQGQSASLDMTIDLSKFGEDVHVTVPAASDVFDATAMTTGGFGG